ncbi:MAG: AAA family ATPase [Rubrivivax sp.]|nr:AAA family ATPase [Rubrivivax sp.]
MGRADDEVARAFAELGIDDDSVLTVPTEKSSADFSPGAVERRKREHEARSLPDGPVLQPATEIKPERVRWLWKHWLAKGKLHIAAGSPGQGKTTIACAATAVVSNAGQWPDGTRCDAGNVLWWSGEDDPADTLLPRMLAMGANPERIYFVSGTRQAGDLVPFDPARDLVGLAAAAAQVGGIALLVVDPVVSAVAGDGNSNTVVRRALQPLVTLATALNCAVLGISHFTKTSAGRDPVERVTGSIAFGAVARIVLVAAKVKQADGDRRIFARAKSNIGPDEGGFAYELEQAEVPGAEGLRAATVRWGDSLQGTARELLAEAEQDEDDGEASALDDAVLFLKTELANGQQPSMAVLGNARKAGHAERTLKRAKRDLGVQATKQKEGWFWSLPDKSAKDAKGAKSASPESVAPLAPLRPRTTANNPPDDAEVF